MDDFYQHLDHKLILLPASIGEPGLLPGFSLVKHPQGTRLSNFHGKESSG
jgi:hypothetical protein